MTGSVTGFEEDRVGGVITLLALTPGCTAALDVANADVDAAALAGRTEEVKDVEAWEGGTGEFPLDTADRGTDEPGIVGDGDGTGNVCERADRLALDWEGPSRASTSAFRLTNFLYSYLATEVNVRTLF